MLCSHKFIPQAFLKKFPCHYLEYGNNQSPYVSFSIDNVLENSYMVDNVHGNIVVTANHVNQKADAHIIAGTNSEIKNLVYKYLAIKTADCLPIVFVYQDSNYFLGGITHAGWRGLTTQIISNTISALKTEASRFEISFETFLNEIKVFIGPAIFGISYECGDDVKEALAKYKSSLFGNNKEMGELFDICANVKTDLMLVQEVKLTTKNNTIFPDIQLLAVLECVILGVSPENISIFRENTYGHSILPSFREYSHKLKTGLNQRLWTHLCLPV